MSHTENLLTSLESLNTYKAYYDELYHQYSNFSGLDKLPLEEYVKEIFKTQSRSFFTISSKNDFNNLTGNGNWHRALLFTPLNNHSRIYMKKGDVVFCYRQGQFQNLHEALMERGIYGIGFVASNPKELFLEKDNHERYGVAIIFPYQMNNHLDLLNIQLHPNTISLTPYNGNRNDALQYISEPRHYETLLSLICKKNENLRDVLKVILDFSIPVIQLPTEIWGNIDNKYSFIQSNQSSKVPDVSLNYSQIIYYGVPGAGKSHKIEEEIKKSIPSVQDREYQVLRVVFHPDYTNADFEGQILPGVADGNIRYEFKPGPFTKILKRAYENPEKPFYLVIEEINRGNAAAIFGDIFQLLDRLTDDENNNIGGNTYTKGWSKYFIENDFINAYLRNKKEYSDSAYKDNDTESAKTFFQNITFTSNTGIRLPPNLSLLATMNTSDQNVFALDNAFQRRWDLRLVPNEIPEDSMQYNAEIENTGIKWGKFMAWANRKISESNNFAGTGSMEDRCLGAYFVIHDGRGKIQSKIFAEKVIKYLWDDVFRMERETFFIMEKGESFGSITKRFYKNHSLQEIFKDFEIPENAEYKKESLGYVT